MIDYSLFSFASAPRTGISWFVKACQLAGLGPAFLADPEDHGGIFRVSLVRHPVSWLESVYAARILGWQNNYLGEFGALNVTDGLDTFVWQYLQEMPGKIGELMLGFDADSLLKIEDMPGAFIELASGVGIDPVFFANIEKLPRTNVNPAVKRMSKVLAKRVMESERELCYEYLYF